MFIQRGAAPLVLLPDGHSVRTPHDSCGMRRYRDEGHRTGASHFTMEVNDEFYPYL